MTTRSIGLCATTAVMIVVLCFGAELLPRGARERSDITNAQGIPFPETDQGYQISQALAHFDIYLREPVAFKALRLTFTYLPLASSSLAVGVRENDFWLSYTPVIFYSPDGPSTSEPREATVTVPLTDKLQDADRSIDVLFMANKKKEDSLLDETGDTTLWYIRDIRAEVVFDYPTLVALKDYMRAIISRERPL